MTPVTNICIKFFLTFEPFYRKPAVTLYLPHNVKETLHIVRVDR